MIKNIPIHNGFIRPTTQKSAFKATSSTPFDAQFENDGVFYKRGLHGYIYRWNGEKWINSSMTQFDIKNFRRVVLA